MKSKILIVGESTDNHVRRLLTHLNILDKEHQLDIDIFDLYFHSRETSFYAIKYITQNTCF